MQALLPAVVAAHLVCDVVAGVFFFGHVAAQVGVVHVATVDEHRGECHVFSAGAFHYGRDVDLPVAAEPQRVEHEVGRQLYVAANAVEFYVGCLKASCLFGRQCRQRQQDSDY